MHTRTSPTQTVPSVLNITMDTWLSNGKEPRKNAEILIVHFACTSHYLTRAILNLLVLLTAA